MFDKVDWGSWNASLALGKVMSPLEQLTSSLLPLSGSKTSPANFNRVSATLETPVGDGRSSSGEVEFVVGAAPWQQGKMSEGSDKRVGR
jgi:hypothetical protein